MTMKAPTSIATSLLLVLGLLFASLPLVANGFVFPTYNKMVKTTSSGAPKKQEESPILQTNDQIAASSVMAAAATGFSAALLLLATMTLPLPASAVNVENFVGSYSDPKHPNCKRVIEIVANGNEGEALISGTDGTPGCPADGSGKEWVLQGQIYGGGSKILVDFSPKGGPRHATGEFFEGKESSGITWPDGNSWTKK